MSSYVMRTFLAVPLLGLTGCGVSLPNEESAGPVSARSALSTCVTLDRGGPGDIHDAHACNHSQRNYGDDKHADIGTAGGRVTPSSFTRRSALDEEPPEMGAGLGMLDASDAVSRALRASWGGGDRQGDRAVVFCMRVIRRRVALVGRDHRSGGYHSAGESSRCPWAYFVSLGAHLT